jgi:hypothetical protein
VGSIKVTQERNKIPEEDAREVRKTAVKKAKLAES